MNSINNKSNQKISICIELDNSQFINSSRQLIALQSIIKEIENTLDYLEYIEIIFAYNPFVASKELVDKIICNYKKNLALMNLVHYVECNGGYYDLKIKAASIALGNILVFIDCDVTPDNGWLSQIIAPFNNSSISVVCGTTYVTGTSFFSKICANIWLFQNEHLAATNSHLQKTNSFHANNFAIRKEIFFLFCFPSFISFRGQCRAAAFRMTSAGIVIWRSSTARVNHPAPNGLTAYLIRSYRRGFDLISIWKNINISKSKFPSYFFQGLDRAINIPMKKSIKLIRPNLHSIIFFISSIALIITSSLFYLLGSLVSFFIKNNSQTRN